MRSSNDNSSRLVEEVDRYTRTGDPSTLVKMRAAIRAKPVIDEDDAMRLRVLDDLLSAEPPERLK